MSDTDFDLSQETKDLERLLKKDESQETEFFEATFGIVFPFIQKATGIRIVKKKEVQRQVEDILNQGLIRHSSSPLSSPIYIVPRELDASGKQKWRLVVDYRKLNEKTISNRYPMPNIT